MSREVWDPEQYRAYAGERARPFFELLGRVRHDAPARVVDLGCGPGELTSTLAHRWPAALVEGYDSSPEMIETASALTSAPSGSGRLRFEVLGIEDWKPAGPVDVIVSNAALHWVPGHRELFPRWIDVLAPGGVLAFQVPGNFGAPSHTLLRGLTSSPRWRDLVGGIPREAPVDDPAGYLDRLTGLGCTVDAWETTYLQILPGPDPVLDWVKGTALRPVLAALADETRRADFLGEYAGLLRGAYPPGPQGTVFPFRRVFVVARRT